MEMEERAIKIKKSSVTGVGFSDDDLKCLPQNCLLVDNLRVGISDSHHD